MTVRPEYFCYSSRCVCSLSLIAANVYPCLAQLTVVATYQGSTAPVILDYATLANKVRGCGLNEVAGIPTSVMPC